MKTPILFIVLLVSISSNIQSQILKDDEDIKNKEFTFESLNELDSRMAIQLAERQAQTLLTGIVNKALAAVPYVGSTGVQQEAFGTNLKMDELITLNKNYNYKLTATLGNILKLVKESKDGTIASRAVNLAKRGKLVKQAVDIVSKTERLKKSYETLHESGWRINDMGRMVVQLDVLAKRIETLSKSLLEIWSTADNVTKEREMENIAKQLDDLGNYIDSETEELNDRIGQLYSQKLDDRLARGYFASMYNFEISQEDAVKKYNETIDTSKSILIQIRNIWWVIVSVIAFVAAIGYCFKHFLERDNAISAHIIYWVITLALCAFLGSLLQLV